VFGKKAGLPVDISISITSDEDVDDAASVVDEMVVDVTM